MGRFGGLIMGSVSRGVVRRTTFAVLVVRRRQRIRRIVVGLDESRTAQQALASVGRLLPPHGGRVTIMTALQLLPIPSRRMIARGVASEVRRMNTVRSKAAIRKLNRATAVLKRKGWHTRTILTSGEPLRDLLRTVARERADLLVLGARGTTGVRHLLLGSVAESALNRSPVPVVVARGDTA